MTRVANRTTSERCSCSRKGGRHGLRRRTPRPTRSAPPSRSSRPARASRSSRASSSCASPTGCSSTATAPSTRSRTPQLADIAISSAETAAVFGIEPADRDALVLDGRVGQGGPTWIVREATEAVRERRPDLEVEGPIQYDAAVDARVAELKLPTARWPAARRCSSSPTSRPGTSPTRPSSARPTQSRSAPCSRACGSR